MSRPIKIGFLCPFSTIYPRLGKDMMEGILTGIHSKLRPHFQLLPEFVHQGQPSAIKPALEKLIHFHDVDVVSGLVGYRAMAEFVPTIERARKLALFADMGEYLPFLFHTSDYIFFNSFQYWQAEFALGNWAQGEFGGKGSIFMPVYDAGYHMHSAFRQGVLACENVAIEYAVMAPTDPAQPMQLTGMIKEYLAKFEKERPGYLHVLFCGSEAQEFIQLYYDEGLHREVPLIVSPHMASYEILEPFRHMEMSFYSASMWDYATDDPHNNRFKLQYASHSGGMPTPFSLLGYEIGLALEMLYPSLKAGEYAVARKLLKKEKIISPRGERTFYLDSNYANPTIAIEKVILGGGQIRKMTIQEGKALPYNHFIYEEIHRENISGWLNSYLCV